jgi:hypothetical protein
VVDGYTSTATEPNHEYGEGITRHLGWESKMCFVCVCLLICDHSFAKPCRSQILG